MYLTCCRLWMWTQGPKCICLISGCFLKSFLTHPFDIVRGWPPGCFWITFCFILEFVLPQHGIPCWAFNKQSPWWHPESWSRVEAAPQARLKSSWNIKNILDVCLVFQFHVSPLLGPFTWCQGSVSTVSVPRFHALLVFHTFPIPITRSFLSVHPLFSPTRFRKAFFHVVRVVAGTFSVLYFKYSFN